MFERYVLNYIGQNIAKCGTLAETLYESVKNVSIQTLYLNIVSIIVKEGDETIIGLVPDNAVFSLVEGATPGFKVQKVGEILWPVGFARHPERHVRSGKPFRDMQMETIVKVEELLGAPLSHLPKAEKLHDLSHFSE